MDFSLTREQQMYCEAVVALARDFDDDLPGRDAGHEFAVDAWKRCAAFGIQGLPVPMEYGGQGADPLSIALAMEALGYACRDNGLLFSLSAQMWSCELPLVRFGSEEQKRRYLPGLCDGSLIGVHAMTEPGSGSDAMSLSTTAERHDDGWLLNGSKTFVTNAPVAGLFIVFANVDPGSGFAGITAFIVERDTEGLGVGRPFEKMGLRTSPMSEVILEDCRVPLDATLGGPGHGLAIFTTSMEWERGFILASAVGSMKRQLEDCISFVKQRQQFGQPIGRFQSVANKIVDMKLRLETARLLLYRMAWLKAQGKSGKTEASVVKLYLSECYAASCQDALQIHGGYGYMVESGLERDLRDAIGSRIYSGTSEIQRNLIARGLGL